MTSELKTPYYLFYAEEFQKNYRELVDTFRAIYPKYHAAYSFKTNYTPAVCKLVKELGGFAEVVSDMEYELALKVGFPADQIVYNGPGKGTMLTHCLLHNGMLNIDNLSEVDEVCEVAKKNPGTQMRVGIRVNFSIGTDLHSRFGIDVTNGDFEKAVHKLSACSNLKIVGLHFHISRARGVDAWKKRICTILEIADTYFQGKLDYIDIGSGMYGKLDPELQEQFGPTPTYADYAEAVARTMQEHYKAFPEEDKPMLITEPGTTLVSKYFHLFASVLDMKEIRNKTFALLDCSFHNVGEICGLKKVPVHIHGNTAAMPVYENVDFVGYTCLEQDVMVSGYSGPIEKGAAVEICNVGGYSIVEKPPFIHPDIPIYMERNNQLFCVKRAQTFDDIFAPYLFQEESVQ